MKCVIMTAIVLCLGISSSGQAAQGNSNNACIAAVDALMLDNIAGIELERIRVCRVARQHNSRVEWAGAAAGSMRDKVNVRKLPGIAGGICGR